MTDNIIKYPPSFLEAIQRECKDGVQRENKLFYAIGTEDVQDTAKECLDRRLTPQEMEKTIQVIGDYLSENIDDIIRAAIGYAVP